MRGEPARREGWGRYARLVVSSAVVHASRTLRCSDDGLEGKVGRLERKESWSKSGGRRDGGGGDGVDSQMVYVGEGERRKECQSVVGAMAIAV